jgi:tight adherence protein C
VSSLLILEILLGAVVVSSIAVWLRLRRRLEGPVFPQVARHAGVDPALWAPTYWISKLLLAVLPSVAVLVDADSLASVVLGLLLGAIGFVLPDVVLLLRRKARQEKIQRSMSFFLDLLVSLIRAGLSPDEAFVRAGLRGFPAAHPIAEEVARTASDLKAGVDRAEAFRAFADRIGIRDMRHVAASLEIGGRLGFGVADMLSTQAEVQRDKRSEMGRRKIDRAAIASLFPVMLCGLPLMILIVVVPVIFETMGTLRLLRTLF